MWTVRRFPKNAKTFPAVLGDVIWCEPVRGGAALYSRQFSPILNMQSVRRGGWVGGNWMILSGRSFCHATALTFSRRWATSNKNPWPGRFV
ncbi:hypothetical protein RRG08_005234 [Elysia crispata]|uniref:Uncharacterized protein n=1 Tax=Elysia crispata TaxID=231223 RepID=A0AAE1E0V5_9GAST|nr:hypothetical protein RRG08_005234 [Elysia crispata]